LWQVFHALDAPIGQHHLLSRCSELDQCCLVVVWHVRTGG
jgi:hypothetical protein